MTQRGSERRRKMGVNGMIFLVVSVVIVMKFRKELFAFRRHGPYMFVAAEGLLVLFVLNGGFMFRDPLVLRQIVSWMLMLISAGLAILGFYALKKYGEAATDWEDTTRVVQEGVFRYIRHPLYVSLMFLAGGMLLKDLSLPAGLAFVATFGFLAAASMVEERENLVKFGDAYRRYMLHTKRYVPLIV
jgi:protein-S-isoprenylcysteine O-methyltransferase Ste14